MNKGWEFVSKGTEISLGKFVPEYFTPLTLDLQTGVVSTEAERWETSREEAIAPSSDGQFSKCHLLSKN